MAVELVLNPPAAPQLSLVSLTDVAMDAHLADTIDAHDASAISFVPTGTIAATTVQAAIVEVAAEAGSGNVAYVSGLDTTGATNNTTLVNAAQNALTNGGTLIFPTGTIQTRIAPTKGKVTYKGQGMWATTLIPSAATVYMVEWAAWAPDIAFEDMAFDMSTVPTVGGVLLLNGFYTRNVRFTRCRFYNVENYGVSTQGHDGMVVEDCLFHSDGRAICSAAVKVGKRSTNTKIRNNRFLWLANAVSTDTNGHGVEIKDNYFDGGWWFPVATGSGAGGAGVTYTSTVLTDTGATFGSIISGTVGMFFVRAMTVRRTGSGAGVTYDYTGNMLTDTGATFITAGTLKGDIIRVGSIFAVVDIIVSETQIIVEEWLSDTNRAPVTQPTNGTSYTLYKVTLGNCVSFTATTVTVTNWYDLDGNVATPAAGTRWEIFRHGNYQLHLDGAIGAQIVGNTLRRAWSDQISLFNGKDNRIIGNTVDNGQDYGMTLHGDGTIVALNKVIHQGVVGITTDGAGVVITGNQIEATTWTNPVETTHIAGLVIANSDTVYTANIVDGKGRARSLYGIIIQANAGVVIDGVRGSANISKGHSIFDTGAYEYSTGIIRNIDYGDSVNGVIGGNVAVPSPLARALNLLTTGESTFSPMFTNLSQAGSTGNLYLTYFTAEKTETINTIANHTGSTAAAATPTLCRMGFYSVADNGDLTLLAACANDTTLWAATNTRYSRALTTAFAKVQGQRYAYGNLIVTGAAAPAWLAMNVGNSIVNTLITVGPPRFAAAVGGQTDLPASIAVGSLGNSARVYYAEALP